MPTTPRSIRRTPPFTPIPQVDVLPGGGTQQWIGYRNVTPYWSFDGGMVKVCAYEAQQAPVAWHTRTDAGVTVYLMQPDAGDYTNIVADVCQGSGPNNTWCGCGANLQWCWGGPVANDVVTDMTEQLLRVTDSVTVAGRPYSEVLTGTQSFVSGRLAYWKQILDADNSGVYNSTLTLSDPGEYFVLANQPDGRNPGELPRDELHRHQLVRGDAAPGACRRGDVARLPPALSDQPQPRQPVPQRLPLQLLHPAESADRRAAAVRRGHFGPHAQVQLPPLSRHARAARRPLGPLRRGRRVPAWTGCRLPQMDPTCKPNAKTGAPTTNGRCTRYYITDHSFDVLADGGSPDGMNHDYTGMLRPYLFSDIHLGPDPVTGQIVQVLQSHIEGGPQLLKAQYIDNVSHDFAHCSVKSLFSYLMQRDMRLDGADNDESALLEQLASDFVGDESDPYDFNKLVMELVSLPQYRRIR